MARQRIIKPDFYTDEDLAGCSSYARLLFPGLWMLADRRGRLRDQPAVIHGSIFPYEQDRDVNALLTELDSRGLIQRYEVDGRRFIWIPNFEKHQRPHPKEAESVIPPAPKFHGLAAKGQEGGGGLPVVPSDVRSFVPLESDVMATASGRPVGQANPLIKRSDAERETLRLTGLIAEAENRDGTEVAIEASSYKRNGQVVPGRPRYDTLSDDRLAHTLRWLRDRWRQIEERSSKPAGELPLDRIKRIERERAERLAAEAKA